MGEMLVISERKSISPAVFASLIKKYESYMWYAAQRYSQPPRIEPEDQYQEALLVLHDLASSGEYPLDSVDFDKVFRSKIWWVLGDKLDRIKSLKRDFRKESSENLVSEDNEEVSIWDLDPKLSANSCFSAPGIDMMFFEEIEEIKASLDDTEKRLLDLYLDPTPLKDLIEDYRKARNLNEMNVIPKYLYKDYLKIGRFEFEKAYWKIMEVLAKYFNVPRKVLPDYVGTGKFEEQFGQLQKVL